MQEKGIVSPSWLDHLREPSVRIGHLAREDVVRYQVKINKLSIGYIM